MIKLPGILQDEYQRFYGDLKGVIPEEYLSTPEAVKVMVCSPFVRDYCRRSPSAYIDLHTSGDLKVTYDRANFESKLASALGDITTKTDLMRELRCIRNREMVRIAWRDITQTATLRQTLEELSMLAEILLDETLTRLHQWLAERYGEPVNSQGEPQKMVVIAVGKLGAHELNFSSDIDLIFAFSEGGETRAGKKKISNQEFFIQLGKQLINQFSEITADGFVFRVDMRLRPFGQSGALVLNFNAMEEYYVSHARDWERYAMIKASIAAGDKKAGAELLAIVKPFVFRRYLDYGAFEAIRDMKGMIDREVLRKGMKEDIKLGPGGIREVEFIGQVFQLLRGGREPALQKRSILDILCVLGKLELLNENAISELRKAYYFLRNTEHRLQEIADKQTQSLPKIEIDQARIALGMGCESWNDFEKQLDNHRAKVARQFALLLNVRETDSDQSAEIDRLQALCEGGLESENAIEVLKEVGFSFPEIIFDIVSDWAKNYRLKNLSRIERERFDRVLPVILTEVAKVEDQEKTLKLIMRLIDAVIHRSVYLTLLAQQPVALTQLVTLFSASPWIAAYITQQPVLLDDLMRIDTLYSPMDLTQLEEEVARQLELNRVRKDDLELRMNQLRQFKHSQVLRVAAADITGHIPVAVVSDYLTIIAESVVGGAYESAWLDMIQKYGRPYYIHGDEKKQANMVIIAYGKLGGKELGYGSDLDVVFVHDSQGEAQMTNGNKTIENSVFFNRLAQRIIHLLSVMTSAGRTYEVDARLRPSGASGLLVSSIDGFQDYQINRAWTWEHQALVRARSISGTQGLRNTFESIRLQVLAQQRDEAQLKKDVVAMREKMRETLVTKATGTFDLKHGLGGMTDIEFIVQYSVLLWGEEYPQLLQWTDNLRLLETLASLQLIKESESKLLRDAYFAYRAMGHRLALQDKKAMVSGTEYVDYRKGVQRTWQEFMI